MPLQRNTQERAAELIVRQMDFIGKQKKTIDALVEALEESFDLMRHTRGAYIKHSTLWNKIERTLKQASQVLNRAKNSE